jgi:ADP-dependent NAD(P)H-hydrate dehydratase
MSMDRVTPDFLRANPLPRHEKEGDKNERGRVLVIAGSVEVPGATLLAGLGALRAGAGVLQIATCRSIASGLGMAMPEAMVVGCEETSSGNIDPKSYKRLVELGSTADAILVGPGMIDEPAIAELTSELLRHLKDRTFILDAAAFTTLKLGTKRSGSGPGQTIVTPHSGEMAKFLGLSRDQIDNDHLAAARRAAEHLQAVVAMKGASTHIVSPEGEVCLSENGSIGLATSGSGDTMAGILAGLIARGTRPFLATVWAVFLHGEAGRRLANRNGTFGLLAREIPGEVPLIMEELTDRR